MSRLPISLLILARNEENTITHTIKPLKRWVSEILVLDTGSTDRTVSVAKKTGATVYRERWTGNYALHRNRLLSKASQPWILFLDADQRISPRDCRKLARLVRSRKTAAYYLPHRNYTNDFNLLAGWTRCRGDYRKEEKESRSSGYYSDFRPCLFRGDIAGMQYHYRIHETIVPALAQLGLRSKKASLVIHHYEFHKGLKHHFKKHQRYLKMEMKELAGLSEKDPGYFRLLENAVVDSIFSGINLTRAKRWTRRLVRHDSARSTYWMHAARIAILERRFKEAKNILRRAVKAAPAADVFCLLGWLYLRERDLKAARSYMLRALFLDREHLVSLNLKAMILANEMETEAALQALTKALRLHPEYQDARFNRAALHSSLGNIRLAQKDLKVLSGRAISPDLQNDLRRLKKLIKRKSA